VNVFPGWADIRLDEQSLGYQILNPAGKTLDDIRAQLEKIRDNYYISSAYVGDVDLFYTIQLPGDFVFTKNDDDETDLQYSVPSVMADDADSNTYDVVLAEDNDIEHFWYLAVPDRLTLEETIDESHVVATGLLMCSPFSPLTSSGLMHIPNKLTIEISGGESYIFLQDNNIVRKCVIQVEGETREGAECTEELTMLWDERIQTRHEFRSIKENGIRVYGVEDPTVAFLRVTSADFNGPDYKINYDLDVSVYKEPMELFWALGSGVSVGQKTLDLKKYESDDAELRLEGFTSKFSVLQQELLDEAENNITPLDLTVEPYSDNIWVVDGSKLYLYSAKFPYSDLSLLKGKDYEARSVIEPSSYYILKDDTLALDYVWRRPVSGLIAHRAWVLKPDGTKKSLENGEEIEYHTDRNSWIFGEPRERLIKPTEFYTLDQRGDYVYTLEVVYTDETTSVDKRVVSVLYQMPLAEFDLAELGLENIIGVDFDSECKLWVMDQSGVKYQIKRHYDKMLIDFSKKIIYFREPYHQVRVY